MKQYYYLAGDTQLGPFSPDDLYTKNLTRDTLVWTAGMAGWLRAGDVPELSNLFMGGQPARMESMPPQQQPQPGPAPYYPQQPGGAPHPAPAYFSSGPKPRNWLVESILVTILCCMPFGIAGIVSAARVDAFYNSGDMPSAQRASEEAGKWTKIGFFLSIGLIVLYIVFFGATMMTAINASRRY